MGRKKDNIFLKKSSIQEITEIENDTSMKESGSQKVVSSNVIIDCCSYVFQKIISSETFVVLCNLIHGNFSGPKMHEVFDFHLLALRMNAGTYGSSPECFALDLQEVCI